MLQGIMTELFLVFMFKGLYFNFTTLQSEILKILIVHKAKTLRNSTTDFDQAGASNFGIFCLLYGLIFKKDLDFFVHDFRKKSKI